ncbi:hypothetical protein HDV00_006362 [Rhizophlyctis rosea]|nr:hypothetical protein HDV00_006362 [Rhizophlyctis rosea]
MVMLIGYVADRGNPHLDVQSAVPVTWILTGESLLIQSIPPFTDFASSPTVQSVNSLGGAPAAVVEGAQQTVIRHELAVEVPVTNPYYQPEPRRTLIWAVFGIMVVKLVGQVMWDVVVWRKRVKDRKAKNGGDVENGGQRSIAV